MRRAVILAKMAALLIAWPFVIVGETLFDLFSDWDLDDLVPVFAYLLFAGMVSYGYFWFIRTLWGCA